MMQSCSGFLLMLMPEKWEKELLSGAQEALALPDLSGHTALYPRGHCHGHHEQRQPDVEFLPAVVEKKILDIPG